MQTYNEQEMIQLVQEEGLEVTQVETKHYISKGYIQSGSPLESFIKTIEQVFEDVFVEGRGKKRVYTVAKKYETIQKRVDGRDDNIGFIYPQGFSIALSLRPNYDEEFKSYMRKKYNTNKISKKMVYLEYGINLYKTTKAQKNVSSVPTVCRFINFENEVVYVGRSKQLESYLQSYSSSGYLESYDDVERVEYITFDNEVEMNLAEIYFINKYKPILNQRRIYEGESAPIELFENKTWKIISNN